MFESNEVPTVLAFAPHPDDAELGVGGLMCASVQRGTRVWIVDATEGETGTNGTAEERRVEARHAAEILGVSGRTNLGIACNQIDPTSWAQRMLIVRTLRSVRPALVLVPYSAPFGTAQASLVDRHPDHRNLASLIGESLHLSGLARLEVDALAPFRPSRVAYYSIHADLPAWSLVVDVSPVWETKLTAIRAHRSQFERGPGRTPTSLNADDFLLQLEARARVIGARIGVPYGEALYLDTPLALGHLGPLLQGLL